MTTYTLTGNYIDTGADGRGEVVVRPANISFVMAPGVSTLTYSIPMDLGFDINPTIFDATDIYSVSFDTDQHWGGVAFEVTSFFVMDLTWDDNGTQRVGQFLMAMVGENTDSDSDYAESFSLRFQLGGDPLPPLNTAADYLAFSNQAPTYANISPDDVFGPGQTISLDTLPNVTITENDTVNGGAGSYSGASALTEIDLGAGDDDFYTEAEGAVVDGGEGDDWLLTRGINATLDGGVGQDTLALSGTDGNDLYVDFAAGGESELTVTVRSDLMDPATIINTLSGSDIEAVRGNNFDEVHVEGNGFDNIFRHDGGDSFVTFNGGDGIDQLQLDRTFYIRPIRETLERGLTLNQFLNQHTVSGTADAFVIESAFRGVLDAQLNNVEEIRFTDGTYTLQQVLNAAGIASTTPSDGDDRLSGTAEADVMDAGAGNDTILGGDGDDTIFSGDGRDLLDAGSGVDWLDTSNESVGVGVYLEWGQFRGAQGREAINGFENVRGTNFNDRIVGGSAANEISGGAGNDVLKGKGGNDTIAGDDGNDRIIAGADMDQIFGGAGSDTIVGLAGDDMINGGDGIDYIYGGRDADLISGGAGDDRLRGNIGNDVLFGGDGADDLRGGGSHDMVSGGAGDDYVIGNNGRDTLVGGSGDDVLFGGSGGATSDGHEDVFVFDFFDNGTGGFDRIRDFEDGIDLIDLTFFGFASFMDVAAMATDTGSALRIDFGGGDALYLDDMSLAQFDSSDLLL